MDIINRRKQREVKDAHTILNSKRKNKESQLKEEESYHNPLKQEEKYEGGPSSVPVVIKTS